MSDQVGNSKHWFSCVAARMIMKQLTNFFLPLKFTQLFYSCHRDNGVDTELFEILAIVDEVDQFMVHYFMVIVQFQGQRH